MFGIPVMNRLFAVISNLEYQISKNIEYQTRKYKNLGISFFLFFEIRN